MHGSRIGAAVMMVSSLACAQQIVISPTGGWEGRSQGGQYQADWLHSIPADPNIAFARADTEAAEDPGYVVTIVNRTIKVFNEDGTEALDANSDPIEADLDDFFEFTGFRFDPRVVYDRHAGRFVACAIGSSGGTGLQIHPAISVNANHDIAIVMAQSSANETTSIQVWGRLASGVELGLETVFTSPTGAVLDGALGDREFGDYFDIALDGDDMRFWVIGEYIAGVDPNFYWATRVARIKLEDE